MYCAIDSKVRARARQILTLRGSGLWEGDLGEMRGDAPVKRKGSS